MGRAAALCFGAAALIGVGLVLARGAAMAALGVAGLLGGIGYTAGPRYKYLGLGDLSVFILMGPLMVLGGALAVSGQLGWMPLAASLPVGLLVTAILHANNLRDLEADQASGLHTVAIWLGRGASLIYFRLLVYGASAVVAALVVARVLPWPALLPLVTLPLARKADRDLSSATSLEARRARPLVEQTAAPLRVRARAGGRDRARARLCPLARQPAVDRRKPWPLAGSRREDAIGLLDMARR